MASQGIPGPESGMVPYGALHSSRRVPKSSLAWPATLALLVNESQVPV